MEVWAILLFAYLCTWGIRWNAGATLKLSPLCSSSKICLGLAVHQLSKCSKKVSNFILSSLTASLAHFKCSRSSGVCGVLLEECMCKFIWFRCTIWAQINFLVCTCVGCRPVPVLTTVYRSHQSLRRHHRGEPLVLIFFKINKFLTCTI